MQFEQVLTDCIEALDQGETVEACLARYPQHAAQLLPMLTLVAELRRQPKPRLSAKAFAQIRATLAINAQQAQGAQNLSTPKAAPTVGKVPASNGRIAQSARPHPPRAGHRRVAGLPAGRPVQPRTPHRHFTLGTNQPPATNNRRRQGLLRTLSVSLAVCLLVGLFVFARQATISLPGTPLYAVKQVGEQVQGILMTAAGDEAQWHAQQATLRMGELAQLPPTARAEQATLAQAAATQVAAALAAGALLPQAEQNAFLLEWQAELQQLDATLPQNAALAAPARETVQTALAAVALALTPTPAVLLPEIEATPPVTTPAAVATAENTLPLSATLTLTPALPIATATLALSPTALFTATATPTATLTVTVTPTPVLIPTATASATELPMVVPTATPLPVITRVIGLEESSRNEPEEDNQEQGEASTTDGETTNPTPTPRTDTQSGADEVATSVPDDSTREPTPVTTADGLAPDATTDADLIVTLTPATTIPGTATAAQTPVPFLTPGLTQQPTLLATEASTNVATAIAEDATAQSTVAADPATAAPTSGATSEGRGNRKATATPEPTRMPKPTATPQPNEPTPTRRRTPEATAQPPSQPTAQPTTLGEPTQSGTP